VPLWVVVQPAPWQAAAPQLNLAIRYNSSIAGTQLHRQPPGSQLKATAWQLSWQPPGICFGNCHSCQFRQLPGNCSATAAQPPWQLPRL